MSLFSGYDRETVPQLVQLAQVHLPPCWDSDRRRWHDSEVLEFRRRWHDSELLEFWRRAAPEDHSHPLEQRLSWPKSIPAIDTLAEVCELTKEILGDLADGNDLAMPTLKRLDQFLATHARFSLQLTDTVVYGMPAPIADEGYEGRVPAAQISLMRTRTPDVPQLAVTLALALAQIIDDQQRSPKNERTEVLRCAECRSPFILLRADQRFCSRRCADTNGTRRRREQERQKEGREREETPSVLLKK